MFTFILIYIIGAIIATMYPTTVCNLALLTINSPIQLPYKNGKDPFYTEDLDDDMPMPVAFFFAAACSWISVLLLFCSTIIYYNHFKNKLS